MKTTLLKRLLCIVLVAFLPLSALAETAAPVTQKVITLSFTLGDELRMLPGIGDLFDSLAFQIHSLEAARVFGLSFLLQDEEALSINLRTDEDGFFTQSAAIYSEPLYFRWEDINAVIESALAESGLQINGLASFTPNLPMAMMFATNAAAYNQEPIALKESMLLFQDPVYRQMLINATGGDDTYLVFIESLYERFVETKGAFTGDDHDPATYKLELSITQADLIEMMDTTFMRQQLASQMLPYTLLSGATMDELIDSMIAQSKAELENMDIAMDLTILYNDSSDIVYLSFPISIAEKESSDEPMVISIPTDYRRLTTDGNTAHSFAMLGEMGMNDDDKETFSVKGSFIHYANDNCDLSLDIETNGESQFSVKGIYEINGKERLGLLSLIPVGEDELLIQLVQSITDTGSENHLSFYMKNGNEPMTLLNSDAPLLTVNVIITSYEPDGRFDAINASTPESAIQLLTLEGDELIALIETIGTNALQAGMNFLTLLPPSALQMMPIE